MKRGPDSEFVRLVQIEFMCSRTQQFTGLSVRTYSGFLLLITTHLNTTRTSIIFMCATKTNEWNTSTESTESTFKTVTFQLLQKIKAGHCNEHENVRRYYRSINRSEVLFTIVIYCIARLAFLNYTSARGKSPLIYEREINCLVYLKLGVVKRNIIFNVWRRAQGVINSYGVSREKMLISALFWENRGLSKSDSTGNFTVSFFHFLSTINTFGR